MFCGWLIVAVLGQATQPASAAGSPATAKAPSTAPASRITVMAPLNLSTQPAAALPPPVATPVNPPVHNPVAAASPSSQPADTAAALAAALRQLQGGAPPATQPEGGTVLPSLSGENVDIDVTADGKVILRGNPKDVEILQKFIQELQRQTVPAMQVRVFELKNARAADIATNLKQFWSQAKATPGQGLSPENNIAIVPEPRSNSLMIAAAPQNMEEVASLVDQLDKSTLQIKPYRIALQYIKADEAQKMIEKILKNRQTSLGNAGSLFDVQSDPRTNSLLISAPPSDLDQIKTLISLIDVEPTLEPDKPGATGAVKLAIFRLKTAVASDLITVLDKMLTSSQGAAAAQEQIRRLQLRYKDSRGAERDLSPLNLEKPIKILADPGTNSVIIASVESNIAPIGELISLLDQMPLSQEILVRIYPLEHADATTLQTMLKDVFTQGSKVSDVPGKTQVLGRTPENLPGAALVFPVMISIDPRTNTLIVGGRAEQLLLVEQVVKAIDLPNEGNRFKPQLVRLEHSDVTKLSAALQKIVDARKAALTLRGGPNAASREEVLLIPDPRTNTIIIVAKDDNYQEMAKLAKELDTVSADYLGQIHIINLEKLNSADLAPKLTQLWQARSKLRLEGNLPDDQPAIATDSRSNSLIIASNQEDFDVISKLVKELEQQKVSAIAKIQTVRIQNSDTTKIADNLRKLFDARIQLKPKGQEDVSEDKVVIVEDVISRMLLVAATPTNYDEIVRLVSLLDTPLDTKGLIRTFFIKNADVSKTAETLNKMFTEGLYYGGGKKSDLPESLTKVTIVPDVRSSAIIASGSPENMLLIENLLQQLDRQDIPNTLGDARIITLKNADAVRVADILTQIIEGLKAINPDVASQLQLKVIPNTQNNTVVISGSRLAMRKAEDIIPQLDSSSEASAASARVEVYHLNNAPAPRVAQMLTDMLKQSGQAAGKTTAMVIGSDETSNSIIVTAPREQQDIVKDVLLKLDIPSAYSSQVQVITLVHAKAEQLADTLTKLIQAQSQGGGTKAPTGFAVTAEPRTNSLLVFAPSDAMTNIRKIVKELDNTESPSIMAMRVFPLHNSRAEDLAKLLEDFFKSAGVGDATGKETRQMIIKFSPIDPVTNKPLVDPKTGKDVIERLVHQDITFKPDPNTNSLMVLAPEGSIDMMAMLIEMLDSVTPVTATIQVFPLQNADATEMKKLLDDLFKAGSTSGGGGTTGAGRRTLILGGGEGGGGAALTATGGAAGAGGENTTAEVAFATDERTNSLIAAGSPSYLKIVERLVLQLDFKEMDERTVRVVHLRNAKATEVATTMSKYFQDETSAIEKATQNEAAPKQLQRHVTITDSGETSNSLLLSYSPRMESQIISMINELDQPPPQVMIQALMAEVTLTDSFELGMEFALQDLLFSEHATVKATPNGPIIQGGNFDTVFGTNLGAAGSGTGLNFTVTGEDFNFLFHALQVEGRVEVLSRPAILVRDNQEATFTVGESVPTVTDINIGPTGQVTPSVTYKDVGVSLEVKPIINPDGFVNLEIKPEISAIGTSNVTVATGITLPTFTQRKADTTVTVKDGETIIIGGLITNQENNAETKLPLVGDIPILGLAFRNNKRDAIKTELLIVLTPHVIRDPTQARTVSVHMRDQTGLNDNIRMSPLMQGLQVKPEDDQFGPLDQIRPGSTQEQPGSPGQRSEEQGPELEEYGPPVSSTTPRGGSDVTVQYQPANTSGRAVAAP